MKKISFVLFGFGLLLFTGIVAWYGAGDVLSALALCGPGLILVTASHIIPLVLDAIGWRFLLRVKPPSLTVFIRLRWLCESINSLLPAAQIGGDIVRSGQLSRHGVPGHIAGASVVVDVTLAVVTQIFFTMGGVAILLVAGENGIAMNAVAGMAVLALLITAFASLQRKGLWSRLLQILSKIGGGGLASSFENNALKLDEELQILYGEINRLIKSGFWRLAGWLAGAVEVWLALYFMGHGISMVDAVMLESLGQAIRAAAFLVPGALGVQEGGFVVLCSIIGITPDVAIGLSLAKRVRELALGIPGLVLWQTGEGKRFLKAAKK